MLYPDDRTYQGKELRLKQQHFFISATIQVITAPLGPQLWSCSHACMNVCRSEEGAVLAMLHTAANPHVREASLVTLSSPACIGIQAA